MASNTIATLRLYRNVLKLHRRCLPDDMRKLGDEYVKSEWRLHKKVTGPMQQKFLDGWGM